MECRHVVGRHPVEQFACADRRSGRRGGQQGGQHRHRLGGLASPETLVAFALGMALFVFTLMLNIVALYVVRRYREQYE